MDANSDGNFGESSPSSTSPHSFAVDNSPLPLPVLSPTCAFCRTLLSSDDNQTPDLEAITVCGDCKFLFLEDVETFSPDMRMPVSRRRYSSSDSIEIDTDALFSHQFSQMITLARQNQLDNQSVDGQISARVAQQSSSRTTPTGSRRFRRAFSDNDSDGFDSLYGETESNVSFSRSRTLHGDADTLSYSVYDSDASVDGHSILENEIFGHPTDRSDGLETDTDTDIDPMNVGYRWNSENEEEEEVGDNDSEWEETDIEGTPLEHMRSVAQLHGLSRLNMRNVHVYGRRRQSLPLEVEGAFPFGVQERIQPRADDLSTSFGELVTGNGNRVGDSLDYLDARGFENLLEHLAEAENSRRGAPPASVSFVDAMPCLTINEDKLNGGMACAICKDSFTIGAVVKQLPCYHLYHPSCIYPWLSARNTCPLCRYELPTDDCNYEASKRRRSSEYRRTHSDSASLDDAVVVDEPSQLEHGNVREQSAADTAGEGDARDVQRNGWFFPIISILGMSLMLWLRTNRRYQPYQRECNQSPRRWWRPYF